MQYGPADPGSDALSSLIAKINDKKPGSSITSVINATTIDLLCKLVSKEDYVSDAERLEQSPDVQNIVDFILYLLRDRRFPPLNASVDISCRARRFMLKVVSKTPIVPSSLIVTGVTLPAERDYIGGGGFGRVFKGTLGGKVVALKVLYKSDNQVAFCREALMWRSLNHKFVLPFLGIHEIEVGMTPQLFLVSPYMKNGTLSQWRKQEKPSMDDIEERILEVAQGMEYIHSEGVVHGDLRGENVLLDNRLHVQIADFGLTRLSDATNTRSGAFHLNFAAPELFGALEVDGSDDDPRRTQMSDVYAFGCLYYEIHYDSIPYAGKSNLQILALVSRGIHPPRLGDQPLSDEAWNVIKRCWTREPLKRPVMKRVVESMNGPEVFSLKNLAKRPRDWRPDYHSRSGIASVLLGKHSSDVPEYTDPVKRILNALISYKPGYPSMYWNLRSPPHPGSVEFMKLSRPYNQIDMLQLATSPPADHMRLYHPRSPWYIDISPTAPNGVTIQDVLITIYKKLSTQIHQRHYYNEELDDAHRRVLSTAFSDRCGNSQLESERGILQVDFLADKFVLLGLIKGKNGMWELKTGEDD